MADFSFDTKDLTQQHPSIKQLYEGGYDLNPYTSNILDGGNFYKFDLFNQPPEEVDPEILKSISCSVIKLIPACVELKEDPSPIVNA